MALVLVLAVLVVAFVLAGCGGSWGWDNNDPVIDRFVVNGIEIAPAAVAAADSAADVTVAAGEPILAICRARDSNIDPLVYTWATSGITGSAGGSTAAAHVAPAAGAAGSGSPQVFVGTAPTGEGLYSLSCAVSDGRGGVAGRTAHIQVLAGGLVAPISPGLVPAAAAVVVGQKLVFVCRTSSALSLDDLTFHFSALRGEAEANGQDAATKNTGTYTAPASSGSTPDTALGQDTVYCVVSDRNGHYGVATAVVTVVAAPSS